MTRREYLGNSIQGITWYRVIVDGQVWTTPRRTFTWVRAKLIAEHLMEQYPTADIEIVGVVVKNGWRF